ncbi:uncharacterized protein LOC127289748 isoform X2 [Leptopilina boulardi]|nr:uncharacterized protein LOC127289748 isoform X2 [Leptopilina boulardi]
MDGLQDAKQTKFKNSKDVYVSRNGVPASTSFPLSEIQICKCSHQCHKLTFEDKQNLFNLFNKKTFDEQSQYIVNCMDLIETKKKKIDKTISQRQAIFHYNLKIGLKIISVCQRTLCNVFGITQRRIQILQNKIKSENKKLFVSIKEEINDNNLFENYNDEIYQQMKENINSSNDSDQQSINKKIHQLFSEKYPEIEISRQICNNDIITENYWDNFNENEFFEDIDEPINDRLLIDENNFCVVKFEEESVRDSLEADGQLGRIKAEMRTEVMKLLDGSSKSSRVKRPKSPHDVLFLNELIREYFDWIGYKYTSNVFVTECELGKQPLDRAFLTQDLGVKETEKSKSLPLLFCVIEAFKELKASSMSSC